MTPQQRELIKENQKILYTFRKGGTNLHQKQKTELRRYVGESLTNVCKKMEILRQQKIILDENNFVINPDFAYFAGFYISETEIEVELIDFQFEPVLQKIAPDFPHKVILERGDNCLCVLKDLVIKLFDIVPIVSGSITFNGCMDYKEGILYHIRGNSLLVNEKSSLITNSLAFCPEQIRKLVQVDTTLAYTLYLREKVFDSTSIVYYDSDNGQIGYVKHNILSKESNPACKIIFPRYTDKQEEILKTFEALSDEQYEIHLHSLPNEIFKVFDYTTFLIRSILNPDYFIIDGRWIRYPYFYNFYRENSQYYLSGKNEIANILHLTASWPIIMNKGEQPQRGAGIYSAYSFFDWDLKW